MAVKDEQAGSGRSKLFRTKSIEQSIKDTDVPETKLRKELNSWDLTVFGVAVVIGAGIFTLTARTAGNVAGPSVSLAFVIAAIACGLAALCYAEFASTVPVAGSAYTFSYATFGEFVAWIIGWDLILEFALASSVVAKGWSLYLGEVMGSRSPIVELGPISFDWGAVLVIAVITILLATGTKLSSRVSLVITAIKVAVVLLVIIVGLFYIDTDNYSPYIPPSEPGSTGEGIHQSLFSYVTGAGGSTFGWYGLLAAASLVFFAFIGFDVVATTAEEAKEPQKALPRGILGSLLIVTVLYVAVTLVLTGMVKYTELEGDTSNLATAFAFHDITWAKKRHLVRRFGRSHDSGDGADARADQGALRDGTRRSDATTPGTDRQARNPCADHDLGRRRGRGARRRFSDRHPRGNGQHRHTVRFCSRLDRGSRAPSDASRPTSRIQGAAGPAGPDSGRPRVSVADVQPVGGDLDEVRGLDGPRRCHLFRLQQAAFDDREA